MPIDVLPLLRHLDKAPGQMSDNEHLLADGFQQEVIDACLGRGLFRKTLCGVIEFTKEGYDQVVFSNIEGTP